MPKTTMKGMMEWAKEQAGKLAAGSFNQTVTVMHNHGDFFYVNHSAWVYKRGDFYAVFTEHDGYRVYHRDDVRVRVTR